MIGSALCLITLALCAAQAPHKDARDHPPQYVGPGRDEPAPDGLSAVLIGWFGPSDPQDPDTGDIWRALNMAVQEANEAGGYEGLPAKPPHPSHREARRRSLGRQVRGGAMCRALLCQRFPFTHSP